MVVSHPSGVITPGYDTNQIRRDDFQNYCCSGEEDVEKQADHPEIRLRLVVLTIFCVLSFLNVGN